ncbi:MAG: hypothetical protein ONB13_08195, partial [candidate division KSB1 bacterium]|nr:hypothetical protein [candidate division KSB1 bacterium]
SLADGAEIFISPPAQAVPVGQQATISIAARNVQNAYAAQVTLVAKQLGKVKTLSREQIQKLEAVRQKYGYQGRKSLCEACGLCNIS